MSPPSNKIILCMRGRCDAAFMCNKSKENSVSGAAASLVAEWRGKEWRRWNPQHAWDCPLMSRRGREEWEGTGWTERRSGWQLEDSAAIGREGGGRPGGFDPRSHSLSRSVSWTLALRSPTFGWKKTHFSLPPLCSSTHTQARSSGQQRHNWWVRAVVMQVSLCKYPVGMGWMISSLSCFWLVGWMLSHLQVSPQRVCTCLACGYVSICCVCVAVWVSSDSVSWMTLMYGDSLSSRTFWLNGADGRDAACPVAHIIVFSSVFCGGKKNVQVQMQLGSWRSFVCCILAPCILRWCLCFIQVGFDS